MLERLFAALREQEAVGEDADCFGIDSTSFQMHPDGTGARRKKGPQSVGRSRGGRDAKIHMVSASDRQAMIFRLSGGQAHDAPEGRALPERWDDPVANAPTAMDRALAKTVGLSPATVHKILARHRLSPHQMRQFKVSTDPEFENKT